jgi:N-methylhydantoinase B
VSVCCGGGGYGPPAERAAERVAHDVAEGWISAERARDVYRVILDSSGKVDVKKTAKLRADSG